MKKNLSWSDYQTYAQTLSQCHYIPLQKADEANVISFTPYIYNACSADCLFCSEKLVRQGKVMCCKEYAPAYTQQLAHVLTLLKRYPLFFSISGKEPTFDLEILSDILQVIHSFIQAGGNSVGQVIYSNLSGVVDHIDSFRRILQKYPITHLECSRHHYDEKKNQQIMRFKGAAIQHNQIFAQTIQAVHALTALKLVCVLQKGGIHTLEDVCKYIAFAKELGIAEIIFRELALFGEGIDANQTSAYIEKNRTELMDLLQTLPADFKWEKIVQGYYYWSFHINYQGVHLIFEMSDYDKLQASNDQKLHKLIYYPTGKLCTQWNMLREIKPEDLYVK